MQDSVSESERIGNSEKGGGCRPHGGCRRRLNPSTMDLQIASSTTSTVYIRVIEEVISKVRKEFFNNGAPGEDVLNQLQGLWELKMMQAGSMVGPVDATSDTCEEGRADVDRGAAIPPTTQDFFPLSTGKRKWDELSSQYRRSGYIPQQDGAADVITDTLEVGQGSNPQPGHGLELTSRIPRLDGPMLDPYDDPLSAPNIYNYQGVVSKDHNVANTPAPPELQAPNPPALINQNDILDEPLNENDDDHDLDDVNQGEELNTQQLVLAQFDKVRHSRGRWRCTLRDAIMHINNKDVLFKKGIGGFDFMKPN